MSEAAKELESDSPSSELEIDKRAIAARSESATSSEMSAATLKRDLQINDADLDGCMTEQASLYAHYASLYAKAQLQADQAKSRAEIARAKQYKFHRNRLTARGKKFSEGVLEAEVLTDEVYIKAQDIAAKYRMKAALAKEALEAFKQRRDMLIQKGVARREEMKGETFIRAKEQESVELRDRARSITRDSRTRS